MKKLITLFLAEGAYLGRVRAMPGTLGSLWGIPLAWAASFLGIAGQAAFTVLVCVAAIIISGAAAKTLGEKDPEQIVIDEAAGFLAAVFLIPFTPFNLILAFILFRIFDIVKPWPVRQIDKNIKGGAGIVLDDVAAGIFANICVQAVIRIAPMSWRG
ncbi:MAG: phosphatidylglycerophosphatase A [Deltaproteobacteria bacterium]|nr:phosphatidylglycerophosphatase A [Deltaproteobacteria bacterium]